MVVVVVVVEEMEVEAAFHHLLLGLQTQVLDSLPFHLFTILELEVQLVNPLLHHLRYILTSVSMRSTQRSLLVPSQFLWRIFKEVEINLPKNSCGMVGSKEYLLYQKLATESIEHKFGVLSHLVTHKSVAKDGDQTWHHFIQQQYVDTLSKKIEAVKQRIVEYDMIDVAVVPVGVRDSSAVHVAECFSMTMLTFSLLGTQLVGRLLAPTSGQSTLLCQMKIKSAASGWKYYCMSHALQRWRRCWCSRPKRGCLLLWWDDFCMDVVQ